MGAGAVTNPAEEDTLRPVSLTFVALMAIVLPEASRADCATDIQSVRARVAKEADPQIRGAVDKQIKSAEVHRQRNDEVECHNAVTRAWRAFNPPPPAMKKKEDPIDPRRR